MLDAHYVLLHGLHSETRLAPCVVAVLVMLQPGSHQPAACIFPGSQDLRPGLVRTITQQFDSFQA